MAEHLLLKGLEGFLPLYRVRQRWSERFKTVEFPLFPKYLFCRFAPDQYVSVLQTAGVQSVVGFGGRPTPIVVSEIEAVRAILRSGYGVTPWPYLRAGHHVRIETGPLAGIEGILLREKSNVRVVVGVELLKRSVAVDIECDAIVPVTDRHVTIPV